MRSVCFVWQLCWIVVQGGSARPAISHIMGFHHGFTSPVIQ
jgi:hypothetical protein